MFSPVGTRPALGHARFSTPSKAAHRLGRSPDRSADRPLPRRPCRVDRDARRQQPSPPRRFQHADWGHEALGADRRHPPRGAYGRRRILRQLPRCPPTQEHGRVDRAADRDGGPSAGALPSRCVAEKLRARCLCPATRWHGDQSGHRYRPLRPYECRRARGHARAGTLRGSVFRSAGTGDGVGRARHSRSRVLRRLRPPRERATAASRARCGVASLVAAGRRTRERIPSARPGHCPGPPHARRAVWAGDTRTADERNGAAAHRDGVYRLAAGPYPPAPRRLQQRAGRLPRRPPGAKPVAADARSGQPRRQPGRGRLAGDSVVDLVAGGSAAAAGVCQHVDPWRHDDLRHGNAAGRTADLDGDIALQMGRRPVADGGAWYPAAAAGDHHDAACAAARGRRIRARHRRRGLRSTHR